MSTKRSISTISFNTISYLDSVLKDLVENSLIQSYIYIQHQAEEDTKKNHIHMILCPAKPLDPMKVRRLFIEPCIEGDLQCLPFQPSKLGDWVLYALHFPPYLVKKGITRINHYTLDELKSNEPKEWLEDIFFKASEELENHRVSTFIDRMEQGANFGDLLASGLVPFNQVIFYDKLYHTYRPNDNYETWHRATSTHKKTKVQQNVLQNLTP